MNTESTTGLLNVLKNTKIDELEDYIADNAINLCINQHFSDYFYKKNCKPSDIVRKCQGYISKSYIYDLLNGKKNNPSRDNVLLICIAAEMNLKETRRTLELFNHRELYPKDERDAIIAIFINNKIFDIEQINDRLFEHQLDLLGNE